MANVKRASVNRVPVSFAVAMGSGATAALMVLVALTPLTARAQTAPPTTAPTVGLAVVDRTLERSVGDLDSMRKIGRVRVLVSFSRTNFFVSQGRARGFDCDLLTEYQARLQAKFGSGSRAMTVVFVPVAFEDLIPALLDGRGDIAAGGLTITPDRQSRIAFASPHLTGVDEIVVASKSEAAIRSVDDLAGREVRVVKGSSYVVHLQQQSAALAARGKPPIRVVEAPDSLEAEDLLELVNAGVLPLTVVDKPVAEAWADVLPNLSLHSEIAVHQGGQIALAVRQGNPQLLADVNDFIRAHRKGTTIGNILFKRYFEQTRWLQNPVAADKQQKLDQLKGSFQKHAADYGFDWLFLAAQGFQESGLNQSMTSAAGAVGIMQLLPPTARDMGFKSISAADDNIHAGAKYMAYLRDRYFKDDKLPAAAKLDFTLASYNAGPAAVARWRKTAAARGLDPNLWVGNVERISLELIGEETYRYVRNVGKYYVAYKEATGLLGERTADLREAGMR